MKLYSIGQASAMIDMPIRTLRYYESVGLCVPSYVDEDSGYRYYSLENIFRLDLVRCLGRQLGMPLKEIRSYLQESERPEALVTYLEEQSAHLDEQIRVLEQRREFLQRKLVAVRRRETMPTMLVYVEQMPRRVLSVRREQADSLEEAMLLTRRLAAQTGNESWREMYLLFDDVHSQSTPWTERTPYVGVEGSIPGLQEVVLEEGLYVSVEYPFHDQARSVALEKLQQYIWEQALQPVGPVVNSGAVIDTASASIHDYVVKTQMRILPKIIELA